jgi:predicted transcriptional regulator
MNTAGWPRNVVGVKIKQEDKFMPQFEKGKKTAGRPKGRQNNTTIEFKQAVNNLLNVAAPKMIAWLEKIAATDPARALDLVGKLAEYAHPKLARTEVAFDPNESVVFKLEMGKPLNEKKEKEKTDDES